MKNIKKFYSFLTSLLFIVCLLFSSCSVITVKEQEGFYKCYSLTYTRYDTEFEVKVGESFLNIFTVTEDYITISLNSDGTMTYNRELLEYGSSQSSTGTWEKINALTVRLFFQNLSPMICTCDGKTLTFIDEGITVTLKKI